jgi:tRNA-2-methylthio-N6-dimethylallyladenosine synthase
VVQERYERLIALQEQLAGAEAATLLGREVEVLVNATDGRKDGATGRVSGRARDGRLVHVRADPALVRPGDVVTSTITYTAPHHLVADAGVTAHRRWRGAGEPTHPQPALLTIGSRPAG